MFEEYVSCKFYQRRSYEEKIPQNQALYQFYQVYELI